MVWCTLYEIKESKKHLGSNFGLSIHSFHSFIAILYCSNLTMFLTYPWVAILLCKNWSVIYTFSFFVSLSYLSLFCLPFNMIPRHWKLLLFYLFPFILICISFFSFHITTTLLLFVLVSTLFSVNTLSQLFKFYSSYDRLYNLQR